MPLGPLLDGLCVWQASMAVEQMIIRCADNLNPALRQALKGLGEN